MRLLYIPAVVITAVLFLTLVRGASVDVDLDDNDFYLSVDPSDDGAGVLEVHGQVDPSITGIRDSITVTLSSNITEMGPTGPTGRYWHSVVTFDGGAGGQTKVFLRSDGPGAFTVDLDPALWDPQATRDIPVPYGISVDTYGSLVVTASYTGTSEGIATAEAEIWPEPFYLVNLTMSDIPVTLQAGQILNLSIGMKNPSNMDEGLELDIPLLEDLEALGWTVTRQVPDLNTLYPGDQVEARIVLVAPDEITADRTMLLEVSVSTLELDPDTMEPASSDRATIEITVLRSKVGGNGSGNGDPTGEEDGDDGLSGGVAIGVAALFLVMVTLGVLVFILLRNRGGGDGGGYEDHSAPVRM